MRDIVELAANMRALDIEELAACNHFDRLKAVEDSVRSSAFCRAVLLDGQVLCIFGVAPLRSYLLLEDTGVPWLLGTTALFDQRRPLIDLPPSYIAKMLEAYPRLVNFVHAANHRSIRWLRRLGFTLAPAAPHGPNGALFHRFETRRV